MNEETHTVCEIGEEDFPDVASFFGRFGYGLVLTEWIRWKYLDNPLGKGRFFLIRDCAGEILGTLGYIPLLIYSGYSEPTRAMQAVDLFIAPEARGMKLFIELQRFAMNCIPGPLIAFPNERSEKITIELGWQRLASLQTWHFPDFPTPALLKRDRAESVPGLSIMAKIYGGIFLRGRSSRIDMRPIKEFDSDFDDVIGKSSVSASASFLNWRFVGNPMHSFDLFGFYDRNMFLGYCVLLRDGHSASIYDLCALSQRRACFRVLIDFCQRSGIRKLFYSGVGLKLWAYGFIKLPRRRHIISYNMICKNVTLSLRDSDW